MILPVVLAALLWGDPAGEPPAPPATESATHGEESAPPVAAEHAPAVAAEHAPAAASHEEAAAEHHGGGEAEDDPGTIIMHHVLDRPVAVVAGFEITRHMVFFIIPAVFTMVAFLRAASSYGPGGVPTGLGALLEIMVVYVRDEIAEKNIGHGSLKSVPLLLSFFFFILFGALLGLLPFSATAAGNISVTLGLAFVSFLAMQWAGISKHGVVHHFVNMVPSGLPVWLVPIMIPVEIMAMFSRPFALMVRLFANMLAGHMVITALLLLIPIMASLNLAFGVVMIPVSVGLALFIMVLEVLVAFIQAYIFTLLTAIFIGMNAHPAH